MTTARFARCMFRFSMGRRSVVTGVHVIALLAALAMPARGQGVTSATMPAWLKLHNASIVVDGHSDYPMSLMDPPKGRSAEETGDAIVKALLDGGVDVQLYAVWVSEERSSRGDGPATANAEIGDITALIARHAKAMKQVRSAADIVTSPARQMALIAVEGAAGIAESRDQVLALYAQGVRCIGLTWNNSNKLAMSARDEAQQGGRKGARKKKGLTPLGRRIVRLCDSLGIILDISHLGPTAARELLTDAPRPRIASHSGCAAFRKVFRNLDDGQLRAIAANGGVAMVTFVPEFIGTPTPSKSGMSHAAYTRELAPLRHRFHTGDYSTADAWYDVVTRAHADGYITILDVIDNIDHVVKIAGIDHVGIGSDFGALESLPIGLADASDFPFITFLLKKRGYSDTDVAKILGGNFLRVLKQVAG